MRPAEGSAEAVVKLSQDSASAGVGGRARTSCGLVAQDISLFARSRPDGGGVPRSTRSTRRGPAIPIGYDDPKGLEASNIRRSTVVRHVLANGCSGRTPDR